MRKMGMNAILLLLAALPALAAEPAPLKYDFLAFFKKQAPKAAALKELESCIKSCAEPDREFARSLHATLQKAKNEKQLSLHWKDVNDATGRWFEAKRAATDPREVFAATDAAGLVASLSGIFEKKPPAWQARLNETIRGFPLRFPTEARGFFFYGRLLTEENASNEDQLRAYKRCVDLEPSEKWCRSNYEDRVKVYRQPHCKTAGIDPGLGFYRASTTRGKSYVRKLSRNGEPVFVEASPFLTVEAIATIREELPAKSMLDSQLLLEFTPAGAKRLEEETSRKDLQSIAVVLGDEVLVNPRVAEPIPDGRVLIHLGFGSDSEPLFQRLCRKVEQRELPAEFKLKN